MTLSKKVVQIKRIDSVLIIYLIIVIFVIFNTSKIIASHDLTELNIQEVLLALMFILSFPFVVWIKIKAVKYTIRVKSKDRKNLKKN